ncbi:MAG: YeiH family protein [Thermodesulfovibrionales bacterium]
MTAIVLSLLIAVISMWMSSIHPSLDSLVISIILGMLVGNLFEKRFFLQSGLNIFIRFCLPAGIILYGSQLTISGSTMFHFAVVTVIFAGTFGLTLLFGHLLKIRKPFSLLLSTGLSVCGASAIAIASPLIGAKKEETSISIISIMVIGLIGLIIYPLFGSHSGLSNEGIALFTGTTLPMLGQVKVVGSMLGETILQKAVTYKLLRISLLMLLIIWFGLTIRDNKEDGFISFPYILRLILVAGFLVMVIVANTAGPSLQRLLEPFSRFFLTVTLSAIGLSVDFESIADIGPKPLYAVFISWLLTGILVYLFSLYYV